jgi:hypothetical protein
LHNIHLSKMQTFRLIILLISILFGSELHAKAPVFPASEPDAKPRRIIRTCCSFGTEMQLFAIPGIKLTETTSIEKIGPHHYLGDPNEENGIVYTRRGGFIDMGHLRDQADWTAYLFNQLLEAKKHGILSMILGREGGEKNLHVTIPENMDDQSMMLLAGKIAYDLSVWHEIATWFGASTIPFVPERYSSFSVEDAYSNLLGVKIGIQALQSELPYETAMTQIIEQTLKSLDVVSSEQETYLAMEEVRDIWWTREKKLPSGKVMLQRDLQVYACLHPWLVPGWAKPDEPHTELKVPEFTSDGQELSTFYELRFRLNHKFPFRKLFPDRKERNITQNDFDRLLAQIAVELKKKESQFR